MSESDALEMKARKQMAVLIVELLCHVAEPRDPKGKALAKRARRVIDGWPDAVAAGEADYRAYCAADPDHKPEGTADALASCAHMLEEYGPDSLPANENGQVHFARSMMDATAAEIRAFLAKQEALSPPPPAVGGEVELRAAIQGVRDGYASQARFADVDAASYFREFVRRIDAALTPQGGQKP